MSSERPNQTLADYVALAISPALVMGLVGSLVFFLLEVCYGEKGEYKDRLQWILFFFVFGAVLVGRVSMTQGVAGRAGLYGLVLAGLTWIGMQVYVEYPKENGTAPFRWLINLFLVGVVWWCSHRLTWDCTQIDEETEVGGEGLLQATGLEKPADGRAPGAARRGGEEGRAFAGLVHRLVGAVRALPRGAEEAARARRLGDLFLVGGAAAVWAGRGVDSGG